MYRKANWSAIKEDLADISADFEDVCLDMVSVDELWIDFKTRINDTVERNIPSKVCHYQYKSKSLGVTKI